MSAHSIYPRGVKLCWLLPPIRTGHFRQLFGSLSRRRRRFFQTCSWPKTPAPARLSHHLPLTSGASQRAPPVALRPFAPVGRRRSHSQEQLKRTSSHLTRRSSRPLPRSTLPRLAPPSLPHCLPRKRLPRPSSQPNPPRLRRPSPPRSRRPSPPRSSQPSPPRRRPTPRRRVSTRPAARRLAQQLTSGVWPRAPPSTAPSPTDCASAARKLQRKRRRQQLR